MDTQKFIETVALMRAAQKIFFRTKETFWLTESKRFEQMVDKMLMDANAKKIQPTLFDGKIPE